MEIYLYTKEAKKLMGKEDDSRHGSIFLWPLNFANGIFAMSEIAVVSSRKAPAEGGRG
jgi:hypothetical protein